MGPRLDEQLCYSLYSTSRAITQAYKPLLDPLKLTYPQYVVMMALWETDAVSISEIAARTGLTNATLTPLLKRLEKTGYIVSRFTTEDERRKLIVLTTNGKSLGKNANKAANEALCATGLNEKEVKKLILLCASIKKSLISAGEFAH